MTLKKKWFDLIKAGEKKVEYREIKPYWKKRLFDENGEGIKYDFIIFRNGYSKDAPKMTVEFKGVRVGPEYYEIDLGKVSI